MCVYVLLQQSKFKLKCLCRINQVKKRNETKSKYTPLKHLSWDSLAEKYKQLRTQYTRMRLRETRRHRTTTQLRDRLQAIAEPTTTVGKLIKHWRWIEAQGSLDDQAQALATFSENLANATCHRIQIDQGTRKTMRGVRWGVITQKIFGANKARGARSSNRSLKATFRAGPDPRTVDIHVRKKTFLLDVEDDEQNVIAAKTFYAPLIATLGLSPGEYVPFETQADETGCNPDPQYCRRRRLILSLCGKLSKAGETKHVCNFNCYPGTRTYESVVDGVMSNVHATYITILVLRPLIYELPAMVIRARATCNSFDAAAVQSTLIKLRKYYEKHLTPIGMRETGHGSNGDARRVYSMLRNVLRWQLACARDEPEPRDATQQFYRLDTPGFTFCAIKVSLPNGRFYVKDNDSQDAIHKVKLTNRNLLAPQNKKIVFWGFAATRKFFLQLFHNFPRSGKMGHRLRVEDAQYTDRQDFSAVQHRVCLYCRAAMLRLQPRDDYCMRAPGDETGFVLHPNMFPSANGDPETISTLQFLHFVPDETRVYTSAGLSSAIKPGSHGGKSLQHTQAVFLVQIMDSAFIVSTQSLTLQPRQRARLLGFHMRLLRRLRQHVKITAGLTLSDNFCPSQTYCQILVSSHCHINLDRIGRDVCPSQRLIHPYSGEDECEKTFSRAGGNCEVRVWARKYHFKGFLDSVDRQHYLQWASTGAHGERLRLGRAQHIKQEYLPKLFERLADYVRARSKLPPVEHVQDRALIAAFEAGEQDADALCKFCSKVPLPTEPPHTNELRDMDAWSESVSGNARPQLREARQLLLASWGQTRDDEVETQAAVRHMEDLAVEQQLQYAGRAAFDHKVQLPAEMGSGRVLIPIVVREAKAACLLQNTNTSTKMSSDRLSRVVACARRAEDESLRDATALVGEHVGCGVDIAMAFMEDGTPVVYFGRVIACFSTVRGREEIIDWPVSIVDAPDTLRFQCDWFYPFGRVIRRRYLLGIQDGQLREDMSRYPVTAFVGLVDFETIREAGRDVFKLQDNGQMERFQTKITQMGPVGVTRRERDELRERQRTRENGNYYRNFV